MRIAPSSGVQLILDTNTALSGLLWDGPPARRPVGLRIVGM